MTTINPPLHGYPKDTTRESLSEEEIMDGAKRMATCFRGLKTMSELQIGQAINRWVRDQMELRSRKDGTLTAILKGGFALITAELHAAGFKHGVVRGEIVGSEDKAMIVGKGKNKSERRFRFSHGKGERKKRDPFSAIKKLGMDVGELVGTQDDVSGGIEEPDEFEE